MLGAKLMGAVVSGRPNGKENLKLCEKLTVVSSELDSSLHFFSLIRRKTESEFAKVQCFKFSS